VLWQRDALINRALLGAAKMRLLKYHDLRKRERTAVKTYERKNSVGEKLKRGALMCILGSFAAVGLAACGGVVATTVPATATLAPPIATPSAVASATSVPTALPTLTATAQAATATMEVMATDMPTDEPMAMGTPTTEDMIMEVDPTSSLPAATATQVATTASNENAGVNTVSAVLKEWALNLSVSQVAAGKVTFTVTNQGSMGHNLTVVDSAGSVIGATATFQPSEGAQTLEVTLAPGTYTLLCSLPGHAARGQQAQLVVK